MEKLEDFFALGKKLQQLDTEMKAGAINGWWYKGVHIDSGL